ncbi:hypothetical protein H634G_08182 [Metarhizium anisopliae BRIP 53293]|uniref:Uncharacterized protein n=1 Tax=Metarhizium anisopliae BRIP 53293 TaxID=1291518 RepID=A0A0D9NRK5_METAN|nr:hypothetical protein H634G_08182 [Metarhizium anisopliae BRIP 53293]KJK87323.1 hypothetical protein H633G_08837 [Metarhizium anisopliae BRIP 53284]
MKAICVLFSTLRLAYFTAAVRIPDPGCQPEPRSTVDELAWDTEQIPVQHDPELAKYFELQDSAPESWESVPVHFSR